MISVKCFRSRDKENCKTSCVIVTHVAASVLQLFNSIILTYICNIKFFHAVMLAEVRFFRYKAHSNAVYLNIIRKNNNEKEEVFPNIVLFSLFLSKHNTSVLVVREGYTS